MINHSEPLGVTNWFQGNNAVFPAFDGAPTAYIAANFNNTADVGTISNWLLTPVVNLVNGSVLTFYTRTTPLFPDRPQVRMNSNGDGDSNSNSDCNTDSYSNSNPHAHADDPTQANADAEASPDPAASSVTVKPKDVLMRELASKSLASSLP